MRAAIYLLLPFGALAATSTANEKVSPPKGSLALSMLDSIISREQGISVNASVKTSVIEAGLLLTGIRTVLQHVKLPPATAAKYETYTDSVISGLIPALSNATADRTSPLDEFSVGTEFIRQYVETGNKTLLPTIQTLHEVDMMRNRQQDKSYWYFTYTNVTTQDGLFSIPQFISLYAQTFSPSSASAAYATTALQFSNIVSRCLSHRTGLLYHGYDPTRQFPVWGNLTCRGHSESVWGRAMGWTVTGLLLALDVIPTHEGAAVELRDVLTKFMQAVLAAQDKTTGAWWQVMDQPWREGNYLESSATGLFAHAMARGVRLGYLDGKEYLGPAKRAFGWLKENAVVELGDGTLGYNLTVDVCSINSTTTFDFYVAQPLKPNSLLGEVGAILTDVELMLLGN
ncbi:glycosyl hydrolase family 88-domain-containing protein [Coniochaeta sp. 2T2.1]|nr:glycosyl hydrolase family 88-domain-containing protein [Coniochaeta sp. 2T2.1]